MKIPQFLYEYAKYKKDCFLNNPLMKPTFVYTAIEYINNCVNAAECDFISINEAMQSISDFKINTD